MTTRLSPSARQPFVTAVKTVEAGVGVICFTRSRISRSEPGPLYERDNSPVIHQKIQRLTSQVADKSLKGEFRSMKLVIGVFSDASVLQCEFPAEKSCRRRLTYLPWYSVK
jgi:hypothetical protein